MGAGKPPRGFLNGLLLLLLVEITFAVPAVTSAGSAPAPQDAAPSAGAGPRQVIEQLDDALLTNMKQAEGLGYAGRYRNLIPVVERIYDFAGIAPLVLGSQWAKLGRDQQQEFIAMLRDYTIATYAARFDGYSGERFTIKSAEPYQSSVMLVSTDFTEANGKTHSLDYLMKPVAGQWRIVNVIADGVSDLAVKKAEFTHVLEQKGFPGLIADLKSYVARMERAGK